MTEGDAWLLLVAGRSYDGVLRYLWNDSGRQLPAHCFRAEPTGCGDWAAMWAPDPVVTANFGSCDPGAWKMNSDRDRTADTRRACCGIKGPGID
jgi:hypothetical protein